MADNRQGFIEKVLYSIESRIEEWREQDRGRKAEVAANRQTLWEEATERQRLLAQAINAEEQSGELSTEEVAREQRVVFVLHSEESEQALQEFAGEEVRLANVVPSRGGYSREAGVRGSWLVFERTN